MDKSYLDEKLEIDIVRFRGSPLGLLALTTGYQIDTLPKPKARKLNFFFIERKLTS